MINISLWLEWELYTNFMLFKPWFSNIVVVMAFTYGDKVAQLVRCRIGNQRVAGSNPGRLGHFGLFLGNIVYPILLQSTQLYNGYLA